MSRARYTWPIPPSPIWRSDFVDAEAGATGEGQTMWIIRSDLQMLTLLSGKERTQKEYSEMLRTAGFRLDRAIDVGMSTSLLESVAV